MRKAIGLGCFLFCLLVAGNGYGADVAKIAVVDLEKVLMTCESGKKIKAELSKIYNDMEADLQKKQTEIETMKERFEKESMVMSNETREEKRHQINLMTLEAQRQKQKYQKQLNTMQIERLGKLRKEIVGLIDEIGKKEGYLLIVDKVAAHYSTHDLTDRVIQAHNAKRP